MMKNSKPLALAAAGFAVCGALLALSPVSASHASYSAPGGYLPEQIVNQAKEIEPAIDTYGDTGLPKVFPKESVDTMTDAAPQMYS